MNIKKTLNVLSRDAGLFSKSAVVFILTLSICNMALAVVADSFNADKNPSNNYWGVAEVGWIYTPDFSYNLTGVRTKFGSGPGSYSRTVTVEVYNELPSQGGTLLRSAAFSPLANAFAGSSFGSLAVNAGEDYFIGFRNVFNLGSNFTTDPGSVSVSHLFYGVQDAGIYGDETAFLDFTQAILQFEGDQTEPNLPDPCALNPNISYRGITFLSSNIGNGISLDEIRNFVSDCNIDFVVIDFAWITYHWPQTDLVAVEQLAAGLVNNGVQVAAMYRPRALSPSDAPIHYAQNCDGTINPSHNHLCFAYEDSVAWGAQWGTGILNALPSVNKVIIYNLLTPCCCQLCQGGQGAVHAEQFMERCRSEWNAVRPGLQVGHVGLGAEYADQVDFFCPFLIINRWGDNNPVDVSSLLDDLITPDSQPGNKPVIPLAKICWEGATDNTTEDIINTIETCENRQTGFLLWYYDWIFHPTDGMYDPDSIIETLGCQGNPELTFPYTEQSIEPLPWPHQAPGLTEQQIDTLIQQLWIINDFPLYQADQAGDLRYFHAGLDIVLDNGTPIYAMKDGWVKSTDYSTIAIADTSGNAPSYGWEYTHLSNFQVQVGDFVTSGTFIGEVDFDGLPHIHLSKVFSQGDYWGWWRYMCMPNGHFSYIDEEHPIIDTQFYFFENNSDTEIGPDGTGSVVLSGQVDIVVPMREQGLYARDNSSGYGDRLGITKIEYEIRPTASAPGSGQMFQSFDFNDIKIKSNALDAGYNAELTRVVYKHWTFFEGERTSWDKYFSYYIITNCSGEQSPQEINISDRNYCWDTTALYQDDRPIFPNGTYDITVTAYDFSGHTDSQTMSVTVANPMTDLLVPEIFPTIQEAINAAVDGAIISIAPGVYEEEIDFLGKAITVQGTPAAATVDGAGGFAVSFFSGEGSGSVLKNFVIRNSYMAIFLADSSPIIRNVTVCDNEYGVAAYVGAQPDISNSIFWNNIQDDLLFCQASYSCIEDGDQGLGNIAEDPLFVTPNDGNYHLKSEGWRWGTQRMKWTWDNVTSKCIDTGNPGSLLGDELLSVADDPNNVWGENVRINMGAHGGTAQASMPPHDWGLQSDITNDGIVDGTDFAYQAKHWLQSGVEKYSDLSRDGAVDMGDVALLVDEWLKTTTWY